MISHEIPGRIVRVTNVAIDIPVQGVFTYDVEDDPYAVQMIFTVSRAYNNNGQDEEVCWRVSRDLILEAMNKPSGQSAGQGDARVLVDRSYGVVVLCLRNASGHADMKFPLAKLTDFLTECAELCPPGSEAGLTEDALDEMLAEILGE